MEDLIKNKVVIITGASSGIGEACARMLARRGAKVVLGARRANRLQMLVKQIRHDGGKAVFAVTDVSKRDNLLALVKLACDEYGRLDAIVNNAAISQLARIDELQVEDWEEMIDVNFKGVLYGIAAAMPVFKAQGSGHIINIISTSGIKIVPLQGVYAATKNAVRTVAEALRQESRYIRVTGISPGMVQTEFASHIKNEVVKAAVEQKGNAIAIPADAVARAVVYTIEQPDDVEIGDIVIRPTLQD